MTKNSLATLPACLASLAFCDEIVVLDDYSDDGTWEYLQVLAVKAGRRRLDTFAAQRRALCAAASSEWILLVDADEAVTHRLAREITGVLRAPRYAAYDVRQHNLLPAHWQSQGHFSTGQKRLFHRDTARFADSAWVHVPLVHRGPAGRLRAPLLHRSFDSVDHLLRKQLAYAQSGARHLAQLGQRASGLGIVLHTLGGFLKFFIGKGLWRFGSSGLVVAGALAWHAFCKYSLLWERGRGLPPHERTEVPR